MRVSVSFYSYFKELTGCPRTEETLPAGTTLGDLLNLICARFPKMGSMRKSMLVAVGVEYRDQNYVLSDGEEVALFPPVQGG